MKAIALDRNKHPMYQPDNTSQWMLNGLVGSAAGDEWMVTNEPGFVGFEQLPAGYKLLRFLNIPNKRTVVWLKGETSDEIGMLTNRKYSTVFNNACLNFQENRFISAQYRRRQCGEIIYFADGHNEFRYLNLSQAVTSCDNLSFFKQFGYPNLDVSVLDGGGSLPPGMLFFGIRLEDDQGYATPYTTISQPTALYEDKSSSFYPLINGTLPSLHPTVNKSVRLDVTNLDPDFAFYRIGVVMYSSGGGVAVKVYESAPISISNSQFVFSGITDGWTEISIGDFEVDKAPFIPDFCTINENRLLVASEKDVVRDYCNLQQFVLEGITINPVVKQVGVEQMAAGNAKFPYQDTRSFLGDEVYGVGVQFLYNTGELTPIFHKAGRAATPYDLQPLTAVSGTPTSQQQVNVKDVEHLGVSVGQTVPRWKVFNTSLQSGGGVTWGYYEGTATYPEIEACDGSLLYGDLTGSPIRHHRFPSRTTVPLIEQNGSVMNLLGIEVEPFNYPDPNIVGHFIMIGRRTDLNKTVTDTGLLFQLYQPSDMNSYFFGGFNGAERGSSNRKTTPNGGVLLTPGFLFNNQTPSYTYAATHSNMGGFGNYINESFPVTNGGTAYPANAYRRYDRNLDVLQQSNYVPIESVQVGADTADVLNAKTVENRSYSLSGIATLYNKDVPVNVYPTTSPGITYMTLHRSTSVYEDLEAISYYRAHTNPHTGATSHQYFAGDIFISPLSFFSVTERDKRGDDTYFKIALNSHIYVESDINIALRVQNDDDNCGLFFQTGALNGVPYLQTKNDFRLGEIFLERVLASFNTEGAYVLREQSCPNTFVVNRDYSVNHLFPYITLAPATQKCCEGCNGEHPLTIRGSEQGFSDDRIDYFRTFKSGNQLVLEGTKGDISFLHTYKDTVMVFTPMELFLLPKPYRERASSDGVVSIVGTGELFSLPPKKTVDFSLGEGGTIHPSSVITTPFGVFYVDFLTQKAFVYDGSRTINVSGGLSKFFSSKINPALYYTLQGFGVDVGNDNQLFKIQSAWDVLHDRLLVTFNVINPKLPLVDYGEIPKPTPPTQMGWTSDGKFYASPQGTEDVNGYSTPALDDRRFFNIFQATLSFSDKIPLQSSQEGNWLFFHSYTPEFLFYDPESLLYSEKGGKLLAQVADSHFCEFSKHYPFSIEVVVRFEKTVRFQLFEFVSYVMDGHLEKKWETFDEFIVYNQRMSTGIIKIKPRTSNSPNFLASRIQAQAEADAERNYNTWRINTKLRNRASRELPFYTEEDVDYRLTDKEFINPEQPHSWTANEFLVGTYFVVRLSYNGNKKFLFDRLDIQVAEKLD